MNQSCELGSPKACDVNRGGEVFFTIFCLIKLLLFHTLSSHLRFGELFSIECSPYDHIGAWHPSMAHEVGARA